MPQTTLSIEISATPDQVMSVLVDHASYPSFLPHIRSVAVTEVGPADWQVAYTTRVIRDLHYTLRLVQDGHRSLSWSLVEDGVFLRNSGAWTLRPLPGGRTEAEHTLDVHLAVFLPQNIARSLIERAHPETLARFRDEVERRVGASS